MNITQLKKMIKKSFDRGDIGVPENLQEQVKIYLDKHDNLLHDFLSMGTWECNGLYYYNGDKQYSKKQYQKIKEPRDIIRNNLQEYSWLNLLVNRKDLSYYKY